jgi:hypothetical protein
MKNQRGWLLLLIISGLYIFLTFFSDNWIFTEEFFSSQLPVYSIDEIIESRERFWWGSYVVQIVVVIFKVLFAALCIFIGVVLSDIEFFFKDLFRSAIIAETIFIIAQSAYLLNLYFHRSELNLESTANYFPLSMLSFWGTENVAPWLHYPLQTLNLFEVFYILFISWLLSRQWKPDFIESLNIVLPSYGTGLLLWLVLVTFLTLQIS